MVQPRSIFLLVNNAINSAHCLDCGRKLENPEKTNADTLRTYTGLTWGWNPGPSCCEASNTAASFRERVVLC